MAESSNSKAIQKYNHDSDDEMQHYSGDDLPMDKLTSGELKEYLINKGVPGNFAQILQGI